MATSKPTSTQTNTAQANIGIQVLGNIASNILSTNAFEAQIEADTNARIANMDNQLTNYEFTAHKLKEDHRLLDSMFADKISERALQGMKDLSTMKAAAAETGTTGGSTGEAVMQTRVDEMFDIAIINSKRKSALGGILRQGETSKMNAINSFKSLASGGVNIKANGLLSGLAGATNALGSILSTMPNSVRAEMFGSDTTGGNADAFVRQPRTDSAALGTQDYYGF